MYDKLGGRYQDYIQSVVMLSLGVILISSHNTLQHVEGSTTEECDKDWKAIETFCYTLRNSPTSWLEAFSSCLSSGANLAVIYNDHQNKLITSYFSQGEDQKWIGATDMIQENEWKWKINAEYVTMSYTNWDSKEPNDDGGEDCGTLKSNGKWNDEKCSDKFPFICFKEPTTITTFPQSITTKEYGTLQISAVVRTKETIKYTWKRNGELLDINSNNRLNLVLSSTSTTETKISLTVLNVKPIDQGIWEFSITPEFTTITRRCNVTVLEDPKLALSNEFISLFEGSKLQLTCFMTNAGRVGLSSVPDWLWIKDNQNVSTEEFKIENIKTNNSSYTTITKASIGVKDTGRYCCNISGYILQTETCAEIKVYELSPVLKGSNEFINLIEGSQLQVTCLLTSVGGINLSTLPNLLWIKDSNNISTNEFNVENAKTFNSSNTTLSKSDVGVNDTGRYCCHISGYTVLKETCAQVTVYELSPDGITCPNNTDQYEIQWPSTPANNVVQNSCANGKEGKTKRDCNKEGKWMTTDTSQCYSPVYGNIIQELNELTTNTTLDAVESTINNSIQTILLTTTNASVIVAGEINQIINILDSVVNIAGSYNATIDDQNVFKIVDGLVGKENEDSWRILGNTETSDTADISRVLTLVDKTVNLLLNNGTSDTSQNFSGENFVISIDKAASGSEIIFPPEMRDDKSYLVLKSQEYTQNSETAYAGSLFKTISGLLGELTAESNINLYNTGNNDSIFVNSEVLSLKLKDAPTPLSPPLRLNFPNINKTFDRTKTVCVFWNSTSGNGDGGWSTDGCTVQQSKNGLTTCECNHLTNFAVLMQPYETDDETPLALELISIIGCSISILFASLTVLVYVIVWKAIRNDVHLLIICLCMSIIISFSFFLSGGENTDNEVMCKLLTAFLHYFLLVIFFVMLSIGLYYLINVTIMAYSLSLGSTLSAKMNYRVLLIIIWGLPMIISGVTLGSYWNYEYHLPHYCWLSISSGSLYTFIVPVLIIITINIIIIISLVRVLMSVAIVKDNDLKSKVATGIRSLGTQLPVLGVTWLFGILAVSEDVQAFQYLFAIFNSLQGLFIFLFHVVFNSKVRDGLKKRFVSFQSSVSYSSGMTTLSSNTNSEASKPKTPDIKRKIITSPTAETGPKIEQNCEKKRDTILELTSNWNVTNKIIYETNDAITEE